LVNATVAFNTASLCRASPLLTPPQCMQPSTATAESAPPIHRLFFLNITLLQRFYTLWFPLLTLVLLVIRHPAYLGLAILHLLLFENGLAVFFRTDLPDFLRRLRAAPRRGSA
jgi:hypothetical protein